MKTTLLAAAAALSLGIGAAYAGDGEGPAGGYVYPGTIFAGSIYAGTQTPAPSVAAPRNSRATNIFGTYLQSPGVWQFSPNQGTAVATNLAARRCQHL